MRCQYIAGEPSVDDACKCGATTMQYKSYCAEHYRVCHYNDPSPVVSRSALNSAKLAEVDIPEIRRPCAGGMIPRLVAKRYGVSRQAISKIKNGKTWRHVA